MGIRKKSMIHPPGSWDKWTKEEKEELKAGENNINVGERLVFENDKFKIWTIHAHPGTTLNFHKHIHPYYWTVLSGGKSLSHYNDGSIHEAEYEIGDTKYFEDLNEDNFFIHNLSNIGNSTLIFSTVEFLEEK